MNRLWKGLDQRIRLAPVGKILLGALLLFHGWLLLRRLSSGELFDSEIVWRWLGALALLLFWGLERRLAARLSPRARRRSDLAFWSLVLILHSGGVPMTPAGQLLAAMPLAEIGALALPLLVAALVAETVGALLASPLPRSLRAGFSSLDRARLHLATGFLPQVSCRPPPAVC